MTDAISPRDLGFLREHFDGAELEEAKKRLLSGEPLAYIIGEWYFYEETYKVSPACLIPRPETELLVERLVKLMPKNGRFLDLCTGSGCIAISLAKHRPDLTGIAVDISREALFIAEENSKSNGTDERLSFVCADVAQGSDFLRGELFDAIVSNPPYIASSVVPTLDLEVLHEPKIALDGGDDGMDFYRAITRDFADNLTDDGIMLFEIGYDQGDKIRNLGNFTVTKDYSGNDRVALARKKNLAARDSEFGKKILPNT